MKSIDLFELGILALRLLLHHLQLIIIDYLHFLLLLLLLPLKYLLSVLLRLLVQLLNSSQIILQLRLLLDLPLPESFIHLLFPQHSLLVSPILQLHLLPPLVLFLHPQILLHLQMHLPLYLQLLLFPLSLL